MGKKVSKYQHDKNVFGYHFHCPGCECTHGVITENGNKTHPIWTFNGDEESPTFNPSILVRYVKLPEVLEIQNGKYVLDDQGRVKGAIDAVCHSFVKNGKIQFLSDCTHKFAGNTVELPDF